MQTVLNTVCGHNEHSTNSPFFFLLFNVQRIQIESPYSQLSLLVFREAPSSAILEMCSLIYLDINTLSIIHQHCFSPLSPPGIQKGIRGLMSCFQYFRKISERLKVIIYLASTRLHSLIKTSRIYIYNFFFWV